MIPASMVCGHLGQDNATVLEIERQVKVECIGGLVFFLQCTEILVKQPVHGDHIQQLKICIVIGPHQFPEKVPVQVAAGIQHELIQFLDGHFLPFGIVGH